MSAERLERLKTGLGRVGQAVSRACRSMGLQAKATDEAPGAAGDTPPRERMVQTAVELQGAGRHCDAARVFEEAVLMGGDTVETARILNFAASTYYRLGDYPQARTRGLAALELARQCGAVQEEGSACCILGETAFRLGELDIAADHFQEGLDRFSKSGDLRAARQALDRLVQILGDHPDMESAEFYRQLAFEIREADGKANIGVRH